MHRSGAKRLETDEVLFRTDVKGCLEFFDTAKVQC